MNTDDLRPDPLFHALRRIPRRDVDHARAERIRVRCRARIGRRPVLERLGAIETAVMTCAGAMFLSEVILRAARLLGSH